VLAYARLAARRAALVSRSAAERAAAAAVRADRRARLALLETEALPLLRAIAEGGLDIADAAVRDRCARHAAALRQALADRPAAAGGLLGRLEPVLTAARGRGVAAELQVVGEPGALAPEVAAATLAAVDRLLRALPPQPVTLTMLTSGEDVELYMTFDRPPGELPDLADLGPTVPAAAGWSATVDAGRAGAGCLEVRWRRQAAA